MEPRAVSNIDLRRAVLGILLRAGEPTTITEIIDALASQGVTTNLLLARSPAEVVSDLLRYQTRIGRVRKVARATYLVCPDGFSRSTRWRCLHWREMMLRRLGDDPPTAC
jgi:hypothetical protein